MSAASRPEKTDATDKAPRALRPRDAATLVLIDRSGEAWRVLVGKRSTRHVFMPDTYVFPGGRRDRRDHALPYETDLHPDVMGKLSGERAITPVRARALALAALRELQEETGLTIGTARAAGGFDARLDRLRYLARAITPPGMVRRFDTRFFSAFADETGIDPAAIRDSHELHDLRWIDIRHTDSLHMPDITRLILEELRNLGDKDPSLSFGAPVPFYHGRHRAHVRDEI
nr:NUDIX hydrolase [uncultured Gellertiella sp.]